MPCARNRVISAAMCTAKDLHEIGTRMVRAEGSIGTASFLLQPEQKDRGKMADVLCGMASTADTALLLEKQVECLGQP